MLIWNILEIVSLIASYLALSSSNPIIGVLYLITLFVTIAIYLITYGYIYVGMVYILVYVGAIAILFLFIIMLININYTQVNKDNNLRKYLFLLAAIIIAYTVHIIRGNYINMDLPTLINFEFKPLFSSEIYNHQLSTIWSWKDQIHSELHLQSIGDIMFTEYAIYLIIVGLLLLLGMIGAIVLAMRNKKVGNTR